MRAVLQRVSRASVEVDGRIVGRIGVGWLVLLGVARGDADEDADRLADKVVGLRAFEDEAGKMNRTVADIMIPAFIYVAADTRLTISPTSVSN